jgi:hypothetical protein
MIKIECTDFARFENGILVRLYCKMCGTIIGELTNRPLERKLAPNGTIIERHTERFCRTADYCEMKIVYEDGSAHITHGCKSCLQGTQFDEYDLQRITEIDEVDLNLPHREAAPVGIAQIKVGGGII